MKVSSPGGGHSFIVSMCVYFQVTLLVKYESDKEHTISSIRFVVLQEKYYAVYFMLKLTQDGLKSDYKFRK